MPYDLYLVIGIVVLAFAIPSILSAYSNSRMPRIAVLAVLIGGGLVVYAVLSKPGGYNLHDVAHAFVAVIAEYRP